MNYVPICNSCNEKREGKFAELHVWMCVYMQRQNKENLYDFAIFVVKFYFCVVYKLLICFSFCSENEFFDEDNNHLQFYTAFAALAADKLSQCKYGKSKIYVCINIYRYSKSYMRQGDLKMF